MRLTAELISLGHVCMNALRERQLSLRGYKIPSIENLGATQDQFDTFDFSDNEILKFDNFPILKRLACIMLNNNKISVIADNLGNNLPKLETLILTNNRFSQLAELNPLADLPSLRRLSLIGNAVTRHRDYRLYVIALLPKLKILDFNKVSPKERLEALQKFGVIKRSAAAPSVSTSSASSEDHKESAAKTFVPGGESTEISKLTPELREAIKVGIQNAQTMEEIDALEMALSTGRIPRSLAVKLNLPIPQESHAAAATASDSASSSSSADSMQS